MKHIKKLVACGLALTAVAGVYGEIAPHTQTLKAENVTIESPASVENLSVAGLVSSAKVGDTIEVPKVSGYTESVTDINGNVVTLNAENKFVAGAVNYKVTYTKTADQNVAHSFIINVTGNAQTLDFEENSANFIPSEIFVGEKVYLPTPTNEGATVQIFVNNSATALAQTDGKYVFSADKAGSYTIKYVASFDGGAIIQRSFVINVVNADSYNVEVGYTLSSAVNKSLEVNEEYTLPTVSTFNEAYNKDPLDNYTKVEVFYVDKTGNKTAVEVEDNKFTPTKLADGTSYYEIKYTIKTVHSSFGNTVASDIPLIYTIRDVHDKSIKFEELNLNSEVVAGTVKFKPALVNEFDENATITVKVKDQSNPKATIAVIEDDGEFSFTAETGKSYVITLTGEDASGNKITTDGFVVTAISADTTAPKVEDIECDFTAANAGDKVSFIVPKATDNVAVNLTYAVSVDGATNLYTSEDFTDANKVDQSKIKAGDEIFFAMPASDAEISVAVSDGAQTPNTTTKTYTILVNDNVAPTITVQSNTGATSATQGDTVTLPAVKVSDSDIYSTSVTFEVTCEGKTINTYGKKTERNATLSTTTISGVKFVASQSGIYEVKVIAIDAGNNIAVTKYSFEVLSTSNDVMNIGKVPSEVEVYDKVLLPTPEFKDGEKRYEVLEVSDEDAQVPQYDVLGEDTKYFIAYQPGTFVVQYVVYDEHGVEISRSVPYTIVAKDTIKPTFTLNDAKEDLDVQVEFTKDETTGVIDTNKEIYLPGFTSVADSGKQEYVKSYRLVVKDTDGKEYTVTFDPTGFNAPVASNADILSYDKVENRFKLKVNQIGTYTYTYEVTDKNGNTQTLDANEALKGKGSLTAGDIYDPTLNVSKVTVKEKYTYGETFVANIKDLEISDNFTDFETALEEYTNKNLTVTLKRGSETVDVVVNTKTGDITLAEDEELSIGDYELTIKIKDEAGREDERVYNISVKAKETNGKSVENVWGIVLICVSVAILGAVVVYFIVTREKSAPKKDRKETNDKPQE